MSILTRAALAATTVGIAACSSGGGGSSDVTIPGSANERPAYVRGTIDRGGERSALSGEVHDTEFLLEESIDGIAISATWVGDVAEGSCGREVRGTWRLESDKVERAFVLRKQ